MVGYCFTRDDVPDALLAHNMTHETLCLCYEDAVAKYLRAHDHTHTMVINADRGGGGRVTSTAYSGYVLYVAFIVK